MRIGAAAYAMHAETIVYIDFLKLISTSSAKTLLIAWYKVSRTILLHLQKAYLQHKTRQYFATTCIKLIFTNDIVFGIGPIELHVNPRLLFVLTEN